MPDLSTSAAARRPAPGARAARQHDQLPQLADRGGLPDDPEQPRPRGRREPRRARRLRRHRQGGAQLGRASRRSSKALRALGEDETLLVQSGKPVGVFRTHADAPRVLIANSNLVPKWATWEHFHELDRKGLMMYGQMTAGSWIYIGSQGIVQGTYETFVEAGRQHYGGDLAGRWILTAGLGGMGGAQPLAATFAGASLADHRVPAERASTSACARATSTSRRATSTTRSRASQRHTQAKRAVSVGLLGNAAELLPELLQRAQAGGVAARPRHRPDLGARPRQRLPAGGLDASSSGSAAQADPAQHARAARRRGEELRDARAGDARLPDAGHPDRRLRQQHPPGRVRRRRGRRVRLPRLRAGLHPAAVLPRQGAVPLGRAVGRPGGHPQDRREDEGAVPRTTPHLHRWLDMAGERIAFQGLPARICWIGLGERDRAGLAFNEMVQVGRAEGADRHRPRPPRLRLGRLAQPRDRSDEGRHATPSPTGRC